MNIKFDKLNKIDNVLQTVEYKLTMEAYTLKAFKLRNVT